MAVSPRRRWVAWAAAVGAVGGVVVAAAILNGKPGAGIGPWLQSLRDPSQSAVPEAWPLRSISDLLGQATQGRWLWSRWAQLPETLVVQFPDLETQAAALNRVAAWKEKSGAPRERLLDDLALATLIHSSGDNPAVFYGGHDYRQQDLVRFFELADQQHLPLNVQERHLRQTLQTQGWLATGEAAATRALITFTDLQADNPNTRHDETVDAQRRESVLRHELSHARFFLDAAYRARCWAMWRDGLTDAERQRIRQQLGAAGYDVTQEELAVNETQALLLHTADPRAFQPAAFGLSEARWQTLRAAFGDPQR